MPPLYHESVFLNCPFDPEYEPMFHSLVFTVQSCGFVARSAKELNDSAVNRIDKIYNLVRLCGLGIHDISRTDLDPRNQLPRFNMPFELGIFLGATKFGNKLQRSKRCLVLDSQSYRFQKFISDLGGIDPSAHENKPELLVAKVRNWLLTAGHRQNLPGPASILRWQAEFELWLNRTLESRQLLSHEITYLERVRYMSAFLVSEKQIEVTSI